MRDKDDVIMVDITKYAKVRRMWVVREGNRRYHGE